jgi:hypothetical protein
VSVNTDCHVRARADRRQQFEKAIAMIDGNRGRFDENRLARVRHARVHSVMTGDYRGLIMDGGRGAMRATGKRK